MKRLVLAVIVLSFLSCLSTITPSVVSVPQSVLNIINEDDFELYNDGIFLTKDGWNKVEVNTRNLMQEIELLRIELEKFDGK